MPTPARLTFTELVDNVTWFADAAAWNAYLAAITVSISSDNIPEASSVTLGGVYRTSLSAYSPGSVNSETVTIQADIDGSGTLVSYDMPSAAMIVEIQAKLDALATSYAALLSALNSGKVIQLV